MDLNLGIYGQIFVSIFFRRFFWLLGCDIVLTWTFDDFRVDFATVAEDAVSDVYDVANVMFPPPEKVWKGGDGCFCSREGAQNIVCSIGCSGFHFKCTPLPSWKFVWWHHLKLGGPLKTQTTFSSKNWRETLEVLPSCFITGVLYFSW